MRRKDRERLIRAAREAGEPGAGERIARRRALRRARSVLVLVLAAVAALAAAQTAGAASPLADGRAWEMVSPAEKDGASVDPLGYGFEGLIGGLIESSAEGNALTYVTDSPTEPLPEGNRAIEGVQVLANRTPGGWTSKDIITPNQHGEGLRAGTDQEFRAFNSDLSLAAVQPFGERPLQEPPLAGSEPEERSVYRRHNTTCEAGKSGCYEALVTAANDTGVSEGAKTKYSGQLEYQGSSPDLAHTVIKSQVPLNASAPTNEPVGLYEVFSPGAESPQIVSLLPKEFEAEAPVAAAEPELGNGELGENGHRTRNAVSENGQRVFWTGVRSLENAKAEEFEFHQLFMRDTSRGVTIQLNKAVEGVKEPINEKTAEAQIHFQTAAADGSRVFFTDNVPLTPTSKIGFKSGGPADLYVCNIVETETGPTCHLTDLTGSFAKPGGDVLGAVIGANAAGTTVYFAANGAPEGAVKGKCPNPNAVTGPEAKESCNIYVVHETAGVWGTPKLIAVVSALDAPDWANNGAKTSFLTSRVSPSGQYMAFMSERPLTGYDSRDISPQAHEAHDEEVFLYNDGAPEGTNPVTCVSCNPNPAQRPRGVFDTPASGEGNGLVIDPFSVVWRGRWLAANIPAYTPLDSLDAPYQSHYLLDNGRLFFNSADSLVAGDTNTRKEAIPGEAEPAEVGVSDVYEYEPEGLGSCAAGAGSCRSLIPSGTGEHESAFLDASLTGDNVFFITSQPLVSTDRDENFDAYDARECTAASPCITPPPPPAAQCVGESGCRPGSSGTPSFGAPGSQTFSGVPSVGNVHVLPSKEEKPKPLTRAQKLKRALAACRKNYKHNKHKRAACEKRAHHAFGPVKKKATKKKK